MLKLFLLIITVLSSIIIVSCSTLNGVMSENDLLLLNRISGTWEAKNRGTIKINSDRSFIDTILTPLSFAENTYVVDYVLRGMFEIKDGNIHFYDTVIEYSRDAVNKPARDFVYVVDPRRISFEDEFLMLQEFRIFYSTDNDSNIIPGKWEYENYACTYEHNSEQKFRYGKIKETFEFNNDSTCQYSKKYLFETSFEDISTTKTFYYNHPHLEIESLENALVVFHENKMVWFQNDPVFYKKRGIE